MKSSSVEQHGWSQGRLRDVKGEINEQNSS
jgi:hypothetical protein